MLSQGLAAKEYITPHMPNNSLKLPDHQFAKIIKRLDRLERHLNVKPNRPG